MYSMGEEFKNKLMQYFVEESFKRNDASGSFKIEDEVGRDGERRFKIDESMGATVCYLAEKKAAEEFELDMIMGLGGF